MKKIGSTQKKKKHRRRQCNKKSKITIRYQCVLFINANNNNNYYFLFIIRLPMNDSTGDNNIKRQTKKLYEIIVTAVWRTRSDRR